MESHAIPLSFHLFGQLEFDHVLALQRRVAYEAGGFERRHITVLVCEHAPLITVGRRGSRAHIRMTGTELQRRGIETRWMSRGGGCVLHGPGQLAIYPIVPLQETGWSVGQLLNRLQAGICRLFESLGVAAETWRGHAGVWGRTGMLAAVGMTVRNWVSHHGIFLNVNPPLQHYGFVDTAPSGDHRPQRLRPTMSSLVAECRDGVKMTQVRTQLIEILGKALGCPDPMLTTGHPWLQQVIQRPA